MNKHSDSQTRAMEIERSTVGRCCLCIKPCPLEDVWKLLLLLPFPMPETDQLKQKTLKQTKKKYYLQTLEGLG